jgi:mannose-6-phosphate isomerase-like protein (cupin superfamily)
VKILRADDRLRSSSAGIESWHCFSAGAHYDPDNLSFGALIGVDEHLLEPGAGFEAHAHRGVEIISWIAAGHLEHRSGDEVQVINAGESLIQDAAEGIEHAERNPSDDEPLRLIQTTFLAGSNVLFDALRAAAEIQAPWLHVFVADGSWTFDDLNLEPGDSLRVTDNEVHAIDGTGVLITLHQP